MQHFSVTGMSCAACSARVERAVRDVLGVSECSVNLLTNSMVVEGTASTDEIINAVERAGYGASVKGAKAQNTASSAKAEDPLADTETPRLKRRLFTSLGFLLVLMYLTMGHAMLGLPIPAFLEGNSVALALIQLLLAAAIMIINGKFYTNGFMSLIRRAPNMDTLVALGSSAAFVYSTALLFWMTELTRNGDFASASMQLMHLSFEAAAMIPTLITVGKLLEAYSKGKTTDALRALMELAPKTATVIRGEGELSIPIDEVKKGDIFIVRSGESVPVDGIVIDGGGSVDESSLTGESVPTDKQSGSGIYGATILRSGYLKCEATRVGEDTTLSQIVRMVSDAAATKAPIAKLADKVSSIFVPLVMGIALLSFAIWMMCGAELGFALSRGISVLVISCPCALGLATPVAIMVGNGIGAKNGILFKTAASLEASGKTSIVVLDKTGTVTKGTPSITDIICADSNESELISLAYSIEKLSEHPFARAIASYGDERGIHALPITDFETLIGNGVRGKYTDKLLIGGKLDLIADITELSGSIKARASELASCGKTPLGFVLGERFLGIIALADEIKDDSREAIAELSSMGIRVVMLTGDNKLTAEAIGRSVGISEIISGVLPDTKQAVVEKLKGDGKLIMVGDGINDAPALTSADIGIAIGAGADIAIDSADVVLMNSRLSDVPAAIRLSRFTLRTIRQNLFWAFFYNLIGIPIAAGLFIHPLGLELHPMFGAAAMSLSSFCVVTNALRLNLVDIHSTKRDKKKKHSNKSTKENKTMTKTMKIEGMMCMHCSGRVKKALEAISGVEAAEVSHESGTAVVTLSGDVSKELLSETVTAEGYKVLEVI